MSEASATIEGILVFAFIAEGAAAEALGTLQQARKDKTIEYWDAVVVRRDERDRYYFNETRDRSAAQGGGIGAVVGSLLGLPFGPAGIVLGAGLGASLGAFAANTDAGLDDDNLQRLGEALMAGNSALVIVPSRDNLSQMQEYAAQEEVETAIEKLTAGISKHMAKGQNAAYHVTGAGRSVSCHPLQPDNPFAKLFGI